MNPNAGDGAPKPWNKPQPQQDDPNQSTLGADASSAAGEIVGGTLEMAGGCAEGRDPDHAIRHRRHRDGRLPLIGSDSSQL